MNFCDFNCKYASWPEAESLDGSSSCRTFTALFCRKKNRHVHKNMPCNEKSIKRKRIKGSEVSDFNP